MLPRSLPAGFIAPCLPTKADKLPSGGEWLHEIKHDGFRVIARKNGAQVRLYSRPGNDLTHRFPLIVETLARLRWRSCIIDGEAVACDNNGVTSFNRVRYRRYDESIFLYAFERCGITVAPRPGGQPSGRTEPTGPRTPRAQQESKLEARLLLSRSEGGTVARAGGNTCAKSE
jgi:hypothetical protein